MNQQIQTGKINKQAVVIIHGIGEQQPMDTLRSFVDGIRGYLVKKDISEKNTTLRSKPDGIAEIYETRRLSLSASRNRPDTDFYEFYWAHNMRGSDFSHIFRWFYRLFLQSPRNIPPRLKAVWYTAWALVLVIMAASIYIFFRQEYAGILTALLAFPFVLTLFGVLQKFVSAIVLTTAGDAARYFTPTPSNIEERNKIRQQGIAFLKKLHDKNYDRIIVVGHSLGSVIAYDLLRLLWTEMHDTFEPRPGVNQDFLKEVNRYSRNRELIERVHEFQDLQYQAWKQQRENGHAWRVSDFVTLGAAVCCSDYFLVHRLPFTELVRQCEYPVCPPVVDDRTKDIYFNSRDYVVKGRKRTVRLLHHAALFAITRWTNIYFTSDFVGDAACRLFGPGIKDVPISRRSLWFLPGGHTRYWDAGSEESLRSIANALRLRPDNNP